MPDTLDKTATPTVAQNLSESKSYLAAFLLTLFLGMLGTNRLYTGHRLLGWLRAILLIISLLAPGLFVVDITWGVVGISVSGLLLSAISIWWYVDLWLYYLNDVKDARTGKPLTILSAQDKSLARSMMLTTHVAAIALPIITIAGLAIGIAQLQQALPSGLDPAQLLTPTDGLQQLEQLEQQ